MRKSQAEYNLKYLKGRRQRLLEDKGCACVHCGYKEDPDKLVLVYDKAVIAWSGAFRRGINPLERQYQLVCLLCAADVRSGRVTLPVPGAVLYEAGIRQRRESKKDALVAQRQRLQDELRETEVQLLEAQAQGQRIMAEARIRASALLQEAQGKNQTIKQRITSLHVEEGKLHAR